MKKYILKIFLFFAMVASIDFCFGKVCNYLVFNSKKGNAAKTVSMLYHHKYDMLVMGSSRSCCHYDDIMMSDSLKKSILTAGDHGNGVILMYGKYQILRRFYKPRILLYDVEPTFDIYEYDKDDHDRRYIETLKLFYDEDSIPSILQNIDSSLKYKMQSSLFRYNSEAIVLFKDYFVGVPVDDRLSGYTPQDGTVSKEDYAKKYSRKDTKDVRVIDNKKLYYLERLINETKKDGVKMIVIASPKLGVANSDALYPIKNLCKKYCIEFWDYYADTDFVKKPDLFSSGMHLNKEGAEKYTRLIITRCKALK